MTLIRVASFILVWGLVALLVGSIIESWGVVIMGAVGIVLSTVVLLFKGIDHG